MDEKVECDALKIIFKACFLTPWEHRDQVTLQERILHLSCGC